MFLSHCITHDKHPGYEQLLSALKICPPKAALSES